MIGHLLGAAGGVEFIVREVYRGGISIRRWEQKPQMRSAA